MEKKKMAFNLIGIFCFALFIIGGICGALPMFVQGLFSSNYQKAAVGVLAFGLMVVMLGLILFLIEIENSNTFSSSGLKARASEGVEQ